jgi:hypothetical protein
MGGDAKAVERRSSRIEAAEYESRLKVRTTVFP